MKNTVPSQSWPVELRLGAASSEVSLDLRIRTGSTQMSTPRATTARTTETEGRGACQLKSELAMMVVGISKEGNEPNESELVPGTMNETQWIGPFPPLPRPPTKQS